MNNEGFGRGIKDANDLLKLWAGEGVEHEEQVRRARALLDGAPILATACARWAGELLGPERDRAVETAFGLIRRMKGTARAQYRNELSKALRITVREFNDILKAEEKKKGEEKEEVVYTLGGQVKGWLVEYMYDPERDEAKLAWRDPEGKIGWGDDLVIEGVRYRPRTPDDLVRKGVVTFPSGVGAEKSNLELVAIIEAFIHRYYLLDDRKLGRLMAYWVMMTWIFDALEALPYLRAMGDAGSGKSELMKRVGFLCYRLLITGGAGSDSSFFRLTEMFRGTVFMDEMDLADGGNMDNPKVKFLNLGAMRGNPIIRMEEGYDESGKKTFVPIANSTFCPKLLAMRKDFLDEAVGTRSITIQCFEKFPEELMQRGIPLQLTEEFYQQARGIRNLLLRWRLRNWVERVAVDESLIDLRISSRLNQVTIGLKAIARDDAGMLEDIKIFLRAYYQDLMLSKNMGKAARIIEAIWKIWSYPDLRGQMVHGEGEEAYMLVGHVTKIANEIMDVMNALAAEDEEEDGTEEKKRRRTRGVSPRSVGEIIRRELQLKVGSRRGDGYPVFWDQTRMEALATRYGVDVRSLPKIKREVEEGKQEGEEKRDYVQSGF